MKSYLNSRNKKLLNLFFVILIITLLVAYQNMTSTSAIDFPIDNVNGVSIPGGVSVTNQCGISISPTPNTIVYGQASTHVYYGFGINLASMPGAENSYETVLNLIKDLNFTSVRGDYGNPFRVNAILNNPAPVGVTDAQMLAVVQPAITSMIQAHPYLQKLRDQLRAQSVRVTTVMFEIPENYRIGTVNPSTKATTWTMNPSHINDFAQFYVAYLRSLQALSVLPDKVELVNEPDGNWEQQFRPADFAHFTQLLTTGLKKYNVDIAVLAPGTSNVGPAGNFLPPLMDPGPLAELGGVSTHVYFVPPDNTADPNNTIYNQMSQAYYPAFAQLVAAAKSAGIPFIATELGGRFSDQLPSDPSMLLKASLDVMRLGASEAYIWDGVSNTDPFALENSQGAPNPSYYAVEALIPHIPFGSAVLPVTTDTGNMLASAGHAAFAKDSKITFGLTNPSDTARYLTVDFTGLQTLVLSHAYSYTHTSLISVPLNLTKSKCPFTVYLPPFSGVVFTTDKFISPLNF